MNIDGYSQQEIEEFFTSQSAIELLAYEIDEFVSELSSDSLDCVKKIIQSPQYAISIHTYIVSLLGNEALGIPIAIDKDGNEVSASSQKAELLTGEFLIPTYSMIIALAKSRFMSQVTDDNQYKFELAIDIIASLDTILYNVEMKTIKIEEDFTTVTYIRSGISFPLDVALIARYTSHPLPLICKPKVWNERGGGYYLNNGKCTLNKGEKLQPDNIYINLNEVQNQGWELSSNANQHSRYSYVLDKMTEKMGNYIEAETATKNMCMSFADTIEAMKDRQFYFQWKYDFRGREYPTAYDLNPQGDEFMKGAMRPVLWEQTNQGESND